VLRPPIKKRKRKSERKQILREPVNEKHKRINDREVNAARGAATECQMAGSDSPSPELKSAKDACQTGG